VPTHVHTRTAGDLGNLAAMDAETAAKIPSLVRLKDAIYSDTFREFIRAVTGCGELAGGCMCACACMCVCVCVCVCVRLCACVHAPT
jgi:hypothetical protein